MIVTRPTEETVVLGLNYYDAKDAGDNEDMYKYDVRTSEFTPYMRGTFAREFPEYEGHHRASKEFLLDQDASSD